MLKQKRIKHGWWWRWTRLICVVKQVNYWCLASLKTGLWTRHLVIDPLLPRSSTLSPVYMYYMAVVDVSFLHRPIRLTSANAQRQNVNLQDNTHIKKANARPDSGNWNGVVFPFYGRLDLFFSTFTTLSWTQLSYVQHVLPAASLAI